MPILNSPTVSELQLFVYWIIQKRTSVDLDGSQYLLLPIAQVFYLFLNFKQFPNDVLEAQASCKPERLNESQSLIEVGWKILWKKLFPESKVPQNRPSCPESFEWVCVCGGGTCKVILQAIPCSSKIRLKQNQVVHVVSAAVWLAVTCPLCQPPGDQPPVSGPLSIRRGVHVSIRPPRCHRAA